MRDRGTRTAQASDGEGTGPALDQPADSRERLYGLVLEVAAESETLTAAGRLDDITSLTRTTRRAEMTVELELEVGRGCDGCDRVADPEVYAQGGRFGWAEARDADGDVLVAICPVCAYHDRQRQFDEEMRAAEECAADRAEMHDRE